MDEQNPTPTEATTTGIDGTVRKAHYGAGKQPWDTMKENGLAPAFAAGSIIKYLRRKKPDPDDLFDARWYYTELGKLADDVGYAYHGLARDTLVILHRELTGQEMQRLHGAPA